MDIFKISIVTSVVIALVMIFGKLIDKKYNVRWRYFAWLIIALRLCIPFDITWERAQVVINSEPKAVVLRTDRIIPVGIEDVNGTEGDLEPDSANYAPVADLRQIIAFLWAIGCILSFCIPFIQYFIFRKSVKIKDVTYKYADTPVFFAENIAAPMLIGFLKPVILIPCKKYEEGELEMIIEHEKTHKRRGDLWYKLILLAARSIHWFNPLVYVMVNMAQRDLEYSCDYDVCREKDIEFRKKYSMVILKSMKKGAEL